MIIIDRAYSSSDETPGDFNAMTFSWQILLHCTKQCVLDGLNNSLCDFFSRLLCVSLVGTCLDIKMCPVMFFFFFIWLLFSDLFSYWLEIRQFHKGIDSRRNMKVCNLTKKYYIFTGNVVHSKSLKIIFTRSQNQEHKSTQWSHFSSLALRCCCCHVFNNQ